MNSETNPTEPLEPFIPAPSRLSALDQKILQHFSGLVVRKDLTNGLKQNAVVPTYVLEYLLGQHCSTDDDEVIKSGLESVQRILAKHYVHRNQAELVKSTIKEKGRHKVIDKLTVELNDKGGFYEAEFTNLGLKKVPVSDDFVRRYPKLLVGGIWCITDLTYEVSEDQKNSPWQIDMLKPIQVAKVDYDEFLKARKQFTTDEWIDVLMQSLGFNPEMFGRRAKLLTLIRLIPYCERNYNLLELGPKGILKGLFEVGGRGQTRRENQDLLSRWMAAPLSNGFGGNAVGQDHGRGRGQDQDSWIGVHQACASQKQVWRETCSAPRQPRL